MACAQSLATHFGLEVVERDANLLELGKPAAVLLPFNPPPMKLLQLLAGNLPFKPCEHRDYP